MGENMEKIICSCCGNAISASQKFCPECGAPLRSPSSFTGSAMCADQTGTNTTADMGVGMFMGMGLTGMGGKSAMQQEQNVESVNIYPDDSGLKLMADCINTTGPLADGIVRSSEIVLYYDKKTDSYQVHKYASDGYGSKKQEGYYITKEQAARVMRSIDENTVLKYKDLPTSVGGSRILKFRNKNDEIIRAECNIEDLSRIKSSVEGLLNDVVSLENRIIPEKAKNWKSCVVFSTGMSMDSCFQYELERGENGKARVRGNYYISGKAHKQENWIELSEKEADELERIPLGLMLSNVVTNPNLMKTSGFMGTVLDGGSLSVSITYAGGKRDTKIPDGEMIRALDGLMKRVF